MVNHIITQWKFPTSSYSQRNHMTMPHGVKQNLVIESRTQSENLHSLWERHSKHNEYYRNFIVSICSWGAHVRTLHLLVFLWVFPSSFPFFFSYKWIPHLELALLLVWWFLPVILLLIFHCRLRTHNNTIFSDAYTIFGEYFAGLHTFACFSLLGLILSVSWSFNQSNTEHSCVFQMI